MGEYFAYIMDLQVADGYWIQVANYTKMSVSWMSKGSRQRPTAETFWENWHNVFGDKEAPKHITESEHKADMEVVDIEEDEDGLDNG